MKLFFCAAISFLLSFEHFNSFYDITLRNLDDELISLSNYRGKKIVITSFNANAPDTSILRFIDSLDKVDTGMIVIAVPAIDSGGSDDPSIIKQLRDSLHLTLVLSHFAQIKRQPVGKQLHLFKWLTDVNENGHFNIDSPEEGQWFVLNRNGLLYSVLPKAVPNTVLIDVINSTVVQ